MYHDCEKRRKKKTKIAAVFDVCTIWWHCQNRIRILFVVSCWGIFFFCLFPYHWDALWHSLARLHDFASVGRRGNDFYILAIWPKIFTNLIRFGANFDERRLYDLSNVMKICSLFMPFWIRFGFVLDSCSTRSIHYDVYTIILSLSKTERMNQYRINDTFIFGLALNFLCIAHFYFVKLSSFVYIRRLVKRCSVANAFG